PGGWRLHTPLAGAGRDCALSAAGARGWAVDRVGSPARAAPYPDGPDLDGFDPRPDRRRVTVPRSQPGFKRAAERRGGGDSNRDARHVRPPGLRAPASDQRTDARVRWRVVALSGRGVFHGLGRRFSRGRVRWSAVALSGVLAVPCTGNPP